MYKFLRSNPYTKPYLVPITEIDRPRIFPPLLTYSRICEISTSSIHYFPLLFFGNLTRNISYLCSLWRNNLCNIPLGVYRDSFDSSDLTLRIAFPSPSPLRSPPVTPGRPLVSSVPQELSQSLGRFVNSR
jgi:hypothetical protein